MSKQTIPGITLQNDPMQRPVKPTLWPLKHYLDNESSLG